MGRSCGGGRWVYGRERRSRECMLRGDPAWLLTQSRHLVQMRYRSRDGYEWTCHSGKVGPHDADGVLRVHLSVTWNQGSVWESHCVYRDAQCVRLVSLDLGTRFSCPWTDPTRSRSLARTFCARARHTKRIPLLVKPTERSCGGWLFILRHPGKGATLVRIKRADDAMMLSTEVPYFGGELH